MTPLGAGGQLKIDLVARSSINSPASGQGPPCGRGHAMLDAPDPDPNQRRPLLPVRGLSTERYPSPTLDLVIIVAI
jgi:hypothetical protein